MTSKIEWTDDTWNPTTGCSKVSAGCLSCYAERLALRKLQKYDSGLPWTEANAFTNIQLHYDRLWTPIRWKRPRKIFVDSMSDLFHPLIPFDFVAAVFGIMAAAYWHTFQIVTKRPAPARDFFRSAVARDQYDLERSPDEDLTAGRLECISQSLRFESRYHEKGDGGPLHVRHCGDPSGPWPLPNVHLYVSVENQKTFDERVPILLELPAVVRGISAEPLLGPIDGTDGPRDELSTMGTWNQLEQLDHVIVGGESGPGARPMNPEWARSLRDQAADAGVPFFFKQWGQWRPWRNGDELEKTALFNRDTNGDEPVYFRDLSPYRRETWAEVEHGDQFVTHEMNKAKAGRELDGVVHDEPARTSLDHDDRDENPYDATAGPADFRRSR